MGKRQQVADYNTMLARFRAAMVLSGSGDAIGYRHGKWEFCLDGRQIHKELQEMGGIAKINVAARKRDNLLWIVSDDTVMHLATAEALIESGETEDWDELFYNIGKHYQESMKDMRGRGPGPTCMGGASAFNPSIKKKQIVPFDGRGGGCGAAMRAMCIGLRYPLHKDEDKLIKVSVESGRMSHHHPTGYLGAVAAALFTAYSIQEKPIIEWGHSLVNDVIPKTLQYIKDTDEYVAPNVQIWDDEKGFKAHWERYLKERKIADGKSEPVFPKIYDVEERDIFYKYISFSGWGGASGHDAPLIAYDALLAAKDNWTELTNRAFFHAGDSDSTAVMAGCWFGALYGYKDVPKSNYKGLEYQSRLEKAGEELYRLSHIGDTNNSS
ncbi:hypothetical protein LOTGIDRAFT_170414 [Lottia gigantea]|uniref:ADP-ribosylhydrolase ARH1 n=1 Tax=Lottia gigantea TaxID=225164 RepID=V3ZDA0_LOTGI|nr:hypothetical protein LOTGIDRAFT_170414 [Lottia gigantea]ESO82002.1 hypothetical protein LOTGIDRAFT_170414 [Lottia gigantea]